MLGYTPLAAGGAATTAGLLPPTSAQVPPGSVCQPRMMEVLKHPWLADVDADVVGGAAQPSMLPPAAGLLTGGSNPGGGADKQVSAVC